MKFKRSALLAVLAILPFTVGFAPPQEPGTHVSFSAGRGRYMSSPAGCSQPRLVEYYDQQFGVYHRWHTEDGKGVKIGGGLDINGYNSREKECMRSDCGRDDSGWSSLMSTGAFSPYATLDWEWVGFSFGAHVGLPIGGALDDGFNRLLFPVTGRGSFRLGRFDRIYGSIDFLDGRPITSGYAFPFGLGGRLSGFDLWGGIEEFDPKAGVSGALARQIGPVRLRVAGNYMRNSIRFDKDDVEPSVAEDFYVKIPQTAISAGIDYRLPW